MTATFTPRYEEVKPGAGVWQPRGAAKLWYVRIVHARSPAYPNSLQLQLWFCAGCWEFQIGSYLFCYCLIIAVFVTFCFVSWLFVLVSPRKYLVSDLNSYQKQLCRNCWRSSSATAADFRCRKETTAASALYNKYDAAWYRSTHTDTPR